MSKKKKGEEWPIATRRAFLAGEITRTIEARRKEMVSHRRYAPPTGWLPGFEVIEADLPPLKKRGSSAKKKAGAKPAKKAKPARKAGKKKG